jgi:hypothetical protein
MINHAQAKMRHDLSRDHSRLEVRMVNLELHV